MQSAIKVNLPQRSYEIKIASGGLEQLGEFISSLNLGKKVLVFSNSMIFQHYGAQAIASLKSAGFEVAYINLPEGEQHKTLATVAQIYDAALENRLERSSTLVALGGGVIGDMTGFAAATWLRGINFVQIPTTLLAMVDATIGGKTGVNHPQGKNLIGAFHQPQLVLIDPQVLKTLPEREFRAGMAEVIKYGVIWDAELFARLEQSDRLDRLQHIEADLLQEIIFRSCQAKADVVAEDEKEARLRAILNYGHTIGHAVESLTGYRLVNHGEAVAIGMVAAGKLAINLHSWNLASNEMTAAGKLTVNLSPWSESASERQLNLIQKAGLPTQLPAMLQDEAILNSLNQVAAGRVRFVLPTHIGAATITRVPVSPEQICHVLQQMQATNFRF